MFHQRMDSFACASTNKVNTEDVTIIAWGPFPDVRSGKVVDARALRDSEARYDLDPTASNLNSGHAGEKRSIIQTHVK